MKRGTRIPRTLRVQVALRRRGVDHRQADAQLDRQRCRSAGKRKKAAHGVALGATLIAAVAGDAVVQPHAVIGDGRRANQLGVIKHFDWAATLDTTAQTLAVASVAQQCVACAHLAALQRAVDVSAGRVQVNGHVLVVLLAVDGDGGQKQHRASGAGRRKLVPMHANQLRGRERRSDTVGQRRFVKAGRRALRQLVKRLSIPFAKHIQRTTSHGTNKRHHAWETEKIKIKNAVQTSAKHTNNA